jgi:hypothetical protein
MPVDISIRIRNTNTAQQACTSLRVPFLWPDEQVNILLSLVAMVPAPRLNGSLP